VLFTKHLIPIPLIIRSENCIGKIVKNKAEFEVTSGSNYKNSNAVIGDFNKQE
jgi:hypothetical protein